ncbi:MAG: GAF domain-containing protein, partial [Anaerolineales bacterium]|nr:GAF domain-containing protein [Anaerolineales bacterium]
MIVPYPTGLEPRNGLTADELVDAKKRAFRMAAFRLVSDLLISILFLLLARQSGAWQLYQLSFFLLLLIAADTVGALLIRRGRMEIGAKIVISGLLVIVPIAILLTQGLGLVIGLSAILITVTSSYQALPAAAARRMSLLGVFVGIAGIIMDTFLPAEARIAMPPVVETALILITGVLIAIYGILIATQIPRYSTRTKLIFSFLLISLIPLGVFAFISNRLTQAALTDAANQALLAASSETADDLDGFILTNLSELETEAGFPLFLEYLQLTPEERAHSELTVAVDQLLDVFQRKDPSNQEFLLSYSLLDKEGRIIADTLELSHLHDENPDAGEEAGHEGIGISSVAELTNDGNSRPEESPVDGDHAGSSLQETGPEGHMRGDVIHYLVDDRVLFDNYRTVLLTGLTYISPVKFPSGSTTGNLYFMARVADEEGQPFGGLVVNYDAAVLQDIVQKKNNLAGADSFGVLFDEYNTHIAHGIAPETFGLTVAPLRPELVESLKNAFRLPDLPYEELSTYLPELEELLSQTDENPFFSAEDVATHDRINQVAVTDVENADWSVAFFQPQDIFLGPINRQNRFVLLVTLISAALVALAAIPASSLISRPITRLTEIVQTIATGDFSARAPIETNDEIGTLAMSFNLMTDQLNSTLNDLESQVSARTADLSRRAIQLQTASLIGREAASIREIDDLLDQAAHLIGEQFGYYHCGIFLIDERGEFAVLQAASSEGGQRMLEKGHKLRVGQRGIVGFVASEGLPRTAHDVGEDAVYFDNPDLPLTRSELAVPLKVQSRVIGILDVQSRQPSAFSEDDAEVLQIVADQITLAIENARLLDESRQSIDELESLYRDRVNQVWKDHLHN